MVENEINFIGQKVYYKKLENGLSVYFIPDSTKRHYYVNLVTFYGSNDLEYQSIRSNEFVKSPLGIAHFLEHKVFEMADETDPFEFFGRSGTDVNAGTSYYSTKYYMWGSSNFENNMNYFLNMVFNPKFTEKNINKERGIIEEEIKMYDDDPVWQLEDCLRNNLFHNLHVKEKIAGTIESISHIDRETLNDVYQTFYQPSNMALVVAGNFLVDETLELIINHPVLSLRNDRHKIIKKELDEPETVLKEYELLKGNLVIPKLKYSFKIRVDKFSIKDISVINLYLNVIFANMFGDGSEFYEQVYRDNLTTGYYYEHAYYNNYYVLSIEAESEKADLFKELVDKSLENIMVKEEDLSRDKKVWIASEFRMIEKIDIFANSFVDDLIVYGKPRYNLIDIIKSLNYEDLQKVINELDLSNKAFVLMLPKDDIKE